MGSRPAPGYAGRDASLGSGPIRPDWSAPAESNRRNPDRCPRWRLDPHKSQRPAIHVSASGDGERRLPSEAEGSRGTWNAIALNERANFGDQLRRRRHATRAGVRCFVLCHLSIALAIRSRSTWLFFVFRRERGFQPLPCAVQSEGLALSFRFVDPILSMLGDKVRVAARAMVVDEPRRQQQRIAQVTLGPHVKLDPERLDWRFLVARVDDEQQAGRVARRLGD